MLQTIRTKASALRRSLRGDHGATDPILVIAAIAVSLVLLVGGSFVVSGIITNGKDMNAKGDLDKISVAEVAAFAQSDSYVAYAKGTDTALENSGVGFHPTEDSGANLIVELNVGSTKWAAASKSASGAKFIKTSESNIIVTVGKETPATLTKLGLSASDFTTLAGKV